MGNFIKTLKERICRCSKPTSQPPRNIQDVCYCGNCGGMFMIEHKKYLNL